MSVCFSWPTDLLHNVKFACRLWLAQGTTGLEFGSAWLWPWRMTQLVWQAPLLRTWRTVSAVSCSTNISRIAFETAYNKWTSFEVTINDAFDIITCYNIDWMDGRKGCSQEHTLFALRRILQIHHGPKRTAFSRSAIFTCAQKLTRWPA